MFGLVDNIAKWKKNTLDPAIENMMLRGGSAMAEKARELVAKDTGFLESTIGFTYIQSTKTIQLHADAAYALVQEFGSRFMPAHPFMRPAVLAFQTWKTRGINTELQFPAMTRSANPRPMPRANPHAIAANDRINRASDKKFKGFHNLIHGRPSVVIRGQTGRSQTGKMAHPIRERFS